MFPIHEKQGDNVIGCSFQATKTNLRKYFYFLSDVVFYKIINLQYLSNN